jgi:hypothetical protein
MSLLACLFVYLLKAWLYFMVRLAHLINGNCLAHLVNGNCLAHLINGNCLPELKYVSEAGKSHNQKHVAI